MRKNLFVLLFFSACTMGYAQTKISPQTAYFLSLQKEAKQNPGKANCLPENFQTRSIGDTEYVSAYIHLFPHADIRILEELGVKTGICLPEIITAQVPVGKLEEIARLKDVKYVQIGTPVRPLMDQARSLTSVDKVQNGEGLDMPLYGKDVVVGIIDGGFEYGHPNFYNADRTELRVKRVWDQSKKGKAPEGFSYGVEYKTTEEILNAQYDISSAHGTHVAGIAAGADKADGNTYYGVAGEADLVFVSYKNIKSVSVGDLVEVSDAIKYIYDYAESVGKPCVINMSLGSHEGPHDGTSSFDIIADQLQGRGRLLCGAAGNDGDKTVHWSGTIQPGSTEPLKTFIMNSATMVDVAIWGEQGMDLKLVPYVYSTSQKKYIMTGDTIDVSSPKGFEKEYASRIGIQGSIYVSTELNPVNNKPHAYIAVTVQMAQRNNYAGFALFSSTGGTVHAWAVNANCSFVDGEQEGWTAGDKNYTLNEIGGTGKRLISVGAYVSKNTFTLLDGSVKTDDTMVLGKLAPFSSFGPTPDGRVKPDISAPGSYIASSVPGSEYVKSSNIVKEIEWNGKKYLYGMMKGTSMATPVVTGIVATWLQTNPRLSPEDIRTILDNTAIQDEFTETIPVGGNNSWGRGKIDAWKGVKEALVLKAGIEDTQESSLPAVCVWSSAAGSQTIRALFTTADSNVRISVYTISGEKVYGQTIGTVEAAQEVAVTVPTGKGAYILRIEGDKNTGNYKTVLR